jgi:hypothetical protein
LAIASELPTPPHAVAVLIDPDAKTPHHVVVDHRVVCAHLADGHRRDRLGSHDPYAVKLPTAQEACVEPSDRISGAMAVDGGDLGIGSWTLVHSGQPESAVNALTSSPLVGGPGVVNILGSLAWITALIAAAVP